MEKINVLDPKSKIWDRHIRIKGPQGHSPVLITNLVKQMKKHHFNRQRKINTTSLWIAFLQKDTILVIQ